ncbi:MAG: hypothetical protein M5R41_19405 [Bacteroidia bacterium]|nr:hypothetical protein [Bacteroidia bacterium]
MTTEGLPERAERRVESLHDLEGLRIQRRSVFTEGGYLSKPKPAAVVINFNGAQILHLLNWGLYVYKKKE